mgnify:FL=1
MATSCKNRGMDFENMFSSKCKSLREDENAKILINKVPTEMKLIRGAGGRIVKAFAVSKDETEFVDYCGVYYGKPICFELKSTENKTSFPFGNIKESQISFLDKWIEYGGMGYYIIRFAYHKRVFMISALDMHHIINTIGRKSVKYEQCLEDSRFIKLNYDKLNFEDYISNEMQGELVWH